MFTELFGRRLVLYYNLIFIICCHWIFVIRNAGCVTICNGDFNMNWPNARFTYAAPACWSSYNGGTMVIVRDDDRDWGGGSPPSGRYYIALQSNGYGGMFQQIHVPSCRRVQFNFYLRSRLPPHGGIARVLVYYGGNIIGSIEISNSWTQYSGQVNEVNHDRNENLLFLANGCIMGTTRSTTDCTFEIDNVFNPFDWHIAPDACGVCGGPGLNAAGCCFGLSKDCAGTCGGSLGD